MIGYISGNLISADDNGMIILETGGIGYEITCSSSAYELIVNQGKGSLYTYLNVREDGFYLYGFISKEEKSMFLNILFIYYIILDKLKLLYQLLNQLTKYFQYQILS